MDFDQTSEERILDFARFVRRLRAGILNAGTDDVDSEQEDMDEFVLSCKQLISDEKYVDIIGIFVDEITKNFADIADKDVEGGFDVVVSLFDLLKPDQQAVLLDRIHGFLLKEESRVELRFKILVNLFNALPHTSPLRRPAFDAMTRCSTTSDTLPAVVTLDVVKAVQKWVIDWNSTSEEQRELYKLMLDCSNDEQEKQYLRAALLETYEATSETVPESVQKLTIDAVVASVQLPLVKDTIDLQPMRAVQAAIEAYPEVDALLHVLRSQSVSELAAFRQAHPTAESKLGVDADALDARVRLLALCSMGSEASAPLPYARMAQVLGVDVSLVEQWVIRAIDEGAIDAKLDQETEMVTLSRAFQRSFADEHWKTLGDRVDEWIGSVEELLQTLKK